MTRAIDVAFLPRDAGAIDADCWIAIDLLRATTTIATLFERGLRHLTVAASIPLAREIAAREGALLAGEEHGLPPAGFDHGNSPVEAAALDLEGRTAVLATTNGTAAICAVAGRGAVLAGALVNLSAAAARARDHERIAIVCAGNAGGRLPSLEDTAAAGAFVEALAAGRDAVLSDAATIAARTWATGGAALAGTGTHAAALRAIGLERDIAFALEVDRTGTVGTVVAHGDGWARLAAG